MAYAGTKRHLLETKSFANNGNVQVSLKDLPLGRRIRNLILRLELSVAQPGTATAITGKTLIRFLKSVRIGKRVYTSGTMLSVLGWAVRGMRPALPADVPATASTTFVRAIDVVIPYSDERAAYPDDGCPASEFFRNDPIVVDFDAAATLAPTNTPTVTGTLRVIVEHEPMEAEVVPSIVEVGYLDWTGQRVQIDGDRAYTHLFVFNEDGSVITSAEVTGVTLAADGEAFDNVPQRAQDLAFLYDWHNAEGSQPEAASATAPIAGENLTDVQPYTGGGGNVSMEWLPLVAMGESYKLSKVLHTTRQLSLDFQGSKTSFRIGWRAIVPRSEAQLAKAAVVKGVDPRKEWAAKTGSKVNTFNGRLRALLPVRFAA
jgi:hypothetical protein